MVADLCHVAVLVGRAENIKGRRAKMRVIPVWRFFVWRSFVDVYRSSSCGGGQRSSSISSAFALLHRWAIIRKDET